MEMVRSSSASSEAWVLVKRSKSIVASVLFGWSLVSCQSDIPVASEPPQPLAAVSPTPPKFHQGKSHPFPTGVIVAGRSVGALSLGASHNEAIAALGETLDVFD